MEAAIRKRAVLKRKVTNFETFVKNLQTKETLSSVQLTELRKRSEDFGSLINAFDEIQSQIENLTPDNFDDELAKRDEFEQKYYTLVTDSEILLAMAKDTQSSGSSHSSSKHSPSTFIRLPLIHLPKYNGSTQNWIEFRDTFESLIHNNDSLSNIQKYHYLKSSLVDKAADVLRTQAFSADNYETAWETICRRYNDKRGLIRNHVHALFSLQSTLKESSVHIRRIIDNTLEHSKFLGLLVPDDKLGEVLIVHNLVSFLDPTTKRDWETLNNSEEIPSLSEFIEFLEQRASILEALECGNNIQKGSNSTRDKHKNSLGAKSFVTNTAYCNFCKAAHSIYICEKFKALSVQDRISQSKTLKLCLNCLARGHMAHKCKSQYTCRTCKAKHNSLLHIDVASTNNSLEDSGAINKQSTSAAHDENVSLSSYITDNTNILLSTALVSILDSCNKPHNARVLLDSGSQSNFITHDLCEKLKLKQEYIQMNVSGLGNSNSNISSKCNVILKAKHNNYTLRTSCLIIPSITGSIPNTSIDTSHLMIPPNVTLADPLFNTPGNIDLLLGASCFYDLLCIGQISLGKGQPKLQKTLFGYVISGPISLLNTTSSVVSCNVSAAVIDIQDQLTKFWETEECNLKKPCSLEEMECENHFVATTTRCSNGKFIVTIPFKESTTKLGDSCRHAKRALLSLENRLKSNDSLRENYSDFMHEYKALSHMSLTSPDNTENSYYLPHHAVIKEESCSTKLRVVFNGSASTTSGYSRNDLEMVGPVIQRDLFSILVNFRSQRFAISSDIHKMYRQVLVNPSQRQLQKILWRNSPTEEICTYTLNTVTYGTASASFLAIRCLHQLGIECKDNEPQIAKIILEDFYVDDLLTATDSLEEAQHICNALPKILSGGGFPLKKWMSNDPRVLKDVPINDMHPDFLQLGSHSHTKTLGLYWNFKFDHFTFIISSPSTRRVTKRTILSDIAQIFDPLGLLGPSIIIPKFLLQQLWLKKLSWDESIPNDLHEKWIQFRAELMDLNKLEIPRHAVCVNHITIEIHGFCDASIQGYGACIYIRSIDCNASVHCRLLCSKGKVAPLKTLTIPKLELCGAALLSKLMSAVVNSLRCKIHHCYLWTDSTIVLGWLKTSPHLLKTFVAHRVADIQVNTREWTWSHISTNDNPADVLSRGMMPSQLVNCQIWWHGPNFLAQSQLTVSGSSDSPETLPELKNVVTALLVNKVGPFPFQNYSNLSKLEKIIAYCIRFKHNCSVAKGMRNKNSLSLKEIDCARLCLVKIAQQESFSSEINLLNSVNNLPNKNRLLYLSPFLDQNGLLRVGGRILNSEYTFDKKHPLLLDGHHPLSKLIIAREHIRLLHGGAQLTLSNVREHFWITNGRNLSKQVVHNCVTCFKCSPRGINPIMGNLPRDRITVSSPFSIVGIDYAGPLSIKSKSGRGCTISKCYICAFICFSTKAIHIELVSDLSTQAFIMCLRRFVSRRGKPSKIYSDNATNFVGANSKLKELYSFLKLNANTLVKSALEMDIEWHFIPPQSPHFGGLWEAGVKSIKHHLRRISKGSLFTFEELSTLLTQIEATLNARPLSPLSCDPNDLNPLTPAHFLIGRHMASIPHPDVTNVAASRLKQFERIQQLHQLFWRRWRSEYVGELQRRVKWQSSSGILKPDQLVILKDDNSPVAYWRLGRILQVFGGSDGVNRVATIKTSQGVVRRAFSKICPLPEA